MNKIWLPVLSTLGVALALIGQEQLKDTDLKDVFSQSVETPVSTVMFAAQPPPAPSMALPTDSGYLNVKDFGAKGDGITDDTEAFRKVFGRNKEDPDGPIREIYIPNGTYIVSDTLEWGDKKKDVRGESRDGVIIKLKDNSPGFQDVNHPQKVLKVEFGHGGQNFNQQIRNLTVDIGKGNPGAIGIGFHTNNGGGVQDVVIRSSDPGKRGHTGLMMDKAWPGPGLIKNVYIDGFDTGIYITHDQYSMTFEHLLLTNQQKVGFVNSLNTVSIRDLKSINRVPAVKNEGQTALMTLIDSELIGGGNSPAIINSNDGVLFARNIKTQGYQQAIDNQTGNKQQVKGPNVYEFVSEGVSSLFSSSQKSLRLPIEDPPNIPYGDPKTWVSVTQFGAKPDDDIDDGAAIQQAIDSGAETIYLPAGAYISQQSIYVRGNVRRLFGLNANVTFNVPDQPAFIIQDGKYDAVAVDVDSNYGNQSSYWIDHASKRTLILSHGSYMNSVQGGKVFVEDNVAVPMIFDHQKVWMRQINTESYDYNPHIVNKGSDLWILGLKTEKDRTIIRTYDGGRTEVLGGLLYKNQERIGPAPAFICEDCQMSLVYRNKGLAYQTQILETRNGVTKEFSVEDMAASNWRMPLYASATSRGENNSKNVSLSILNPGFEQPVPIDRGFTVLEAIPGWEKYDPSGLIPTIASSVSPTDAGVYNPPTDAYPGEAPEGQNVGFVFVNQAAGSGVVGFTQQLDSVLEIGLNYTLKVDVGNPRDDFGLTGFPGYAVQLLAGDTILAEDNNTLSLTEGIFATSTISYTATAGSSNLGYPLEIRLLNLNLPQGSGRKVDFDNVRLTASVPEPGTTLGLLVAVAFGAGSALKKS